MARRRQADQKRQSASGRLILLAWPRLPPAIRASASAGRSPAAERAGVEETSAAVLTIFLNGALSNHHESPERDERGRA
jgi:hypothetical protein